jgi:hypothetical protein
MVQEELRLARLCAISLHLDAWDEGRDDQLGGKLRGPADGRHDLGPEGRQRLSC